MRRPAAHAGFTLMELMITVAIVAILAAIAYPSYTEQVKRSRRSDAKAALLEAVQWVERQYTVSNSYAKRGDGSAMNTAALTTANLTGAVGSIATYYTLSFSGNPTDTAFTLQMVPKGTMAGDRCGTFTVTNTGARTSGATDCWDR